MRSSNPVLTGRGFARINPEALDNRDGSVQDVRTLESRPNSAPMSIDDVIIKTAGLFAVLVAVGAFAWQAQSGALAIIGLVAGFILAMVNSFSKKVRPALVIAYAAAQGLALGTISWMYEQQYQGIVGQAVVATACAFTGVLVAYKSGKIRVTPKFTRILMGSLIGYFVFGIFSIFVGFPSGGLGTLIAVGGVVLASMFIVMDLDQIEKAVAAKVPAEESWRCAFGLMVTLVWLYLEVLRLISILRGRD
ncbi:COG4760 Predicted membrane protein [Candidatus Nanopelagicaceae bacterium]